MPAYNSGAAATASPSSPSPSAAAGGGGGGGVGASSQSASSSSAVSSPRQPVSLHTPVRRARTNSADSDGSSGVVRRTRFNSREFFLQQQQQVLQMSPQQPAQKYDSARLLEEFDDEDHDEQMDHLMPLEYGRSKKMMGASFTIFFSAYASLIVVIQFSVTTVFLAMGWGGTSISSGSSSHDHVDRDANYGSFHSSGSNWWHGKLTTWTVTNAAHLLVTIIYIHWLKGSFLLDEQGELNAMTTWEQLEAVPYAKNNVAVRRTLLTVPTVLAYTACVTSHFDPVTCFINVVLWSIAMLAKLPFMNGVRLFGINRTAGIDDCVPRSKKQS